MPEKIAIHTGKHGAIALLSEQSVTDSGVSQHSRGYAMFTGKQIDQHALTIKHPLLLQIPADRRGTSIIVILGRWSAGKGARMALAALLLLFGEAASATTPPPSGFVDASTFGYNTTDATTALQNAIDTGSNVFVPNMGTPWNVTPIMLTHNNQEVLFESGTVIEAKAGAFMETGVGNGTGWQAASLFNATGSSGVSLVGPGATLRMRQSDYTQAPYRQGQNAMRSAITLLGVRNFTIDGLTIKDTGGDGIFAGLQPGTANLYSDNVTIKNVIVNNAYRNGISLVGTTNVLIDNSTIVNTTGIAPKAGIDVEPDGLPCDNITTRNTILNANGVLGIVFSLGTIAVNNVASTHATIENVTVVGNGSVGIELYNAIMPNLTVKDSLVGNNNALGFYSNISDATGAASGQPRNAITNSDIWGHQFGNTAGWVTQGTGSINSPSPTFYSTDINSPYYMYLDPSSSALITHGASDGGYMGARPVYSAPEPSALVLITIAALAFVAFRCRFRNV